MTKRNTALAKNNGANLKDMTILAKTAAHITAEHPEIAGQRATTEISQPVRSANPNPHMRTNSHPVIEQLQRSVRLNKPTQSNTEVGDVFLQQLRQNRTIPTPRVPMTPSQKVIIEQLHQRRVALRVQESPTRTSQEVIIERHQKIKAVARVQEAEQL